MEDKYVIEGYDEEMLRKLCEKYQALSEQGIDLPPTLLILDDILGSVKNSDFFKQFISTYRKYNITILLATQYPSGINTLAREQISHAFVFKQTSKPAFTRLYEAIGTDFEKEGRFTKYLKQATEKPYHCLWYNADGEFEKDKFTVFNAPATQKNIQIFFSKKPAVDKD